MSEMKKLYNNNVQKATKSCAVIAREKRRNKALHAFSIKELLEHFDLYKNNQTTCPKCQEVNSLKITESEFTCGSCKQKGHTIKLVALAEKTTHWKAINYIENLQQQKSQPGTKPKSDKNPSKNETLPTKKKPTQKSSFPKNNNKLCENIIVKIKSSISLVDVVREDGIKLKRQGNNLLGLCPFHNDRTPSFVIQHFPFQCDTEYAII